MSESRPNLSVVVGVRAADGGAERCLNALRAQIRDGVQVVVVDDGSGPGDIDWAERRSRPRGLVPELWAEGMRHARGRLVALTVGTVEPAPGWIEDMLGGPDGDASAAGGPVEPGRGLRLRDWAVYFCRYSAYMAPVAQGPARDLAGDNVCYRADVLGHYRDVWQDGFWEPFVHEAMRRDGHALELRTGPAVHHTGGMPLRRFALQRFRHGSMYGRIRGRGMPRRDALRRVLVGPVVPFVMTARTAGNVLRRRRHRLRLATSLPLVFLLFACWAAGETAGYLRSAASRP